MKTFWYIDGRTGQRRAKVPLAWTKKYAGKFSASKGHRRSRLCKGLRRHKDRVIQKCLLTLMGQVRLKIPDP